MATTDYLELRYFNNSKASQEATLTNARTFPFLDVDKHNTISVVRFDADNGRIPLFVPNISKPLDDLAYDEQNHLRDLFKPDPIVLQKHENNNIQQSGEFDIHGDYIAFVTNNIIHSKYTQGSFLTPQTVNTVPEYYAGVWNRQTGQCLWVDHLTDMYITPTEVEGYDLTGAFVTLLGCKFSADGTNLYIFYAYELSYDGVPNGIMWNYITVDTQYGGSVTTANLGASDNSLGLPISMSLGSKLLLTPYKCTNNFAAISYLHFISVNEFPSLEFVASLQMTPGHFVMAIDMITSPSKLLVAGDVTGYATTAQLDAYRVIYTIEGFDGNDHIKVFNYKFTSDTWNSSTVVHEELYDDIIPALVLNAKMTVDGEEILISQVNPETLYGDQSTIQQDLTLLIRDEYDTVPDPWKGAIGDNKTVQTNLQMMLEHRYIPSNNNSKKTALSSYVNWEHDDSDLIGYASTHTYNTELDRLTVLKNSFFHCHSLEHFAKLINKTLKTIFAPMNYSFTSGQSVSCGVFNNKLIILLPSNALNFKFRIIINQELNNIMGFHTVPHETIPNAYVIVIKSGIIQKYIDGERWVISETFRPSQMFPYKTLLFTSNDIHVRPMKRFNNNVQEETQRNMVITDFLLTVESVDFYDVMVHTPEKYDRIINVDNSRDIKNISIRVLLETADGYQVPLILAPLHTTGIVLKIESN